MIETNAFGLGGTKKNIPELIDQIAKTDDLLEKVLMKLLEARVDRDNNKGYYNEEGSSYLKKAVEYQNRINNRIGKLWIAYKKEVKLYHKEHREYIENNFPDPDSVTNDDIHVSHPTLDDNKYYVANDDFNATNDDEIDLVKGQRYFVYSSLPNGWSQVSSETTGLNGTVPSERLDSTDYKPIKFNLVQNSFYEIYDGETRKFAIYLHGNEFEDIYGDTFTFNDVDEKHIDKITVGDKLIAISSHEEQGFKIEAGSTYIVEKYNYNNSEEDDDVNDYVTVRDVQNNISGDMTLYWFEPEQIENIEHTFTKIK